MKPQDIAFFIVTVFLFVFKQPRMFIWTGLISLTLAIPLFAKWIFFTAERLTWYAAAWFLIGIVFLLKEKR